MNNKNFDDLRLRVKGLEKKTVVVACAEDQHALEAVFAAKEEGLAEYVLVGHGEKIRRMALTLGVEAPQTVIIEAADEQEAAWAAVEVVREQEGCFLMKGKMETATLMRAVLDKEKGIRTGDTMSHVALLQVPAYHKLLALTDGGMIPHPTLEQKGMILRNALELYRRLGIDAPKVAVLTASETLNERQPETGEAAALKEMALEGSFGDCVVEGPISFDLAVSGESAALKEFNSPVAGDADILLAPDMANGNMLCKCLIYMSGAKMAGCIMGAKAPIVLTSRGSSAEEKQLSILLAAVASCGE